MRIKKVLASLLSCALILSAMPFSALAAEEHVHHYAETPLSEPSCKDKTNGVSKFTCDECDDYYYAVVPYAHTKDGAEDYVETKAATCGAAGEATYTCVVCGEKVTEVLPATGEHQYVDKVIDPTCTEPAKAGEVCSVCGAVKGTLSVVEGTKPLGHSFVVTDDQAEGAAPSTEKVVTDEKGAYQKVTVVQDFENYTALVADGKGGQKVNYGNVPFPTYIVNDGIGGTKSLQLKSNDIDTSLVGDPPKANFLSKATQIRIVLNADQLTGDGLYFEVYTTVKIASGTSGETNDNQNVQIAKTNNAAPNGSFTWEKRGKLLITQEKAAASSKEAPITFFCPWSEFKINDVAAYNSSHAGENVYFQINWVYSNFSSGAPALNDVFQIDNIGFYEATEAPSAGGTEKPAKEHKDQYKPATCTEDGYGYWECERCDAAKEDVIPASGHQWEKEVFKDADCENGARVEHTCSVCQTTEVVEAFKEGDPLYAPAKGHKWGKEVVTPATCKTGGKTTRTCETCGKTETLSETAVDPTAHKPVLSATLKAATCEENGVGKYTCELCKADLGYKVIPADHLWVEDSRTEANCGKDGVIKYKCSVHEDVTKEVVLPATGKHTWGTEEVPMEADCLNPQRVVKVCSTCGAEQLIQVVENGEKALGHKWVLAEGAEQEKDYKPATCTEPGNGKQVCERCHIAKEDTVIAPTGHTWGKDEFKDADCENASRIAHTCSVCKAEEIVYQFQPGEELYAPAKGHKWGKDVVTPATCKTGGKTTHTCDNCKKTVTVSETPVDPNAHKSVLSATLKEKTCEENGVGKYTCELCGANLGYKVIPADHKWDTVVSSTPATCGKAGTTVYGCSLHPDEKVRKTVTTPATGKHTIEKNKLLEADCLNPQRVAEQYCTVCGQTFGKVDPVKDSKPLGHDLKLVEGNEKNKEATCTEDGYGVFKCSRCDYTEEGVIRAAGHKWDPKTATVVPASCEFGAGVQTTCSVCGATTVDEFDAADDPSLVSPALGHDYSIEQVVAATCAEGGYTLHTCARCGKSYRDNETEINPNNHIPKLVDTLKAATCTSTGVGKYVCANEKCNANLGYKVIPMTDHQWGAEQVDGTTVYVECSVCKAKKILFEEKHEKTHVLAGKPATCTEAGLSEGEVCDNCGATVKEQTVIPALGHQFTNKWGSNETTHWPLCDRCGEAADAPAPHLDEDQDGACDLCNYQMSGHRHVDHLIKVEAKEATCTEAGNDAYYRCEECNMLFSDDQAEHEVQENEVQRPATGHSYQATRSWFEGGVAYVEYTCSKCSDTYTDHS